MEKMSPDLLKSYISTALYALTAAFHRIENINPGLQIDVMGIVNGFLALEERVRRLEETGIVERYEHAKALK